MTRGKWTKKDISTLKRIFPGRPTVEVARELGRPYEATKKRASRMGLRKSRRRMKQLGRA